MVGRLSPERNQAEGISLGSKDWIEFWLVSILSKIGAVGSGRIRQIPFQTLPNDPVESFGITEVIFFGEVELRSLCRPIGDFVRWPRNLPERDVAFGNRQLGAI